VHVYLGRPCLCSNSDLFKHGLMQGKSDREDVRERTGTSIAQMRGGPGGNRQMGGYTECFLQSRCFLHQCSALSIDVKTSRWWQGGERSLTAVALTWGCAREGLFRPAWVNTTAQGKGHRSLVSFKSTPQLYCLSERNRAIRGFHINKGPHSQGAQSRYWHWEEHNDIGQLYGDAY
jgi:hypothetical protein